MTLKEHYAKEQEAGFQAAVDSAPSFGKSFWNPLRRMGLFRWFFDAGVRWGRANPVFMGLRAKVEEGSES